MLKKIFSTETYYTNIGRLRFSFDSYIKVEDGIPYVNSLNYYTIIDSSYVAMCGVSIGQQCPIFNPADVENIGQIMFMLKMIYQFFLRSVDGNASGDVQFNDYEDYMNRMEGEYADIEASSETKQLMFILVDSLSGYDSVYSINIDIAPPKINVSPSPHSKTGRCWGKVI